MTTNASDKCMACDGCGKVANTEDHEPWTMWTSMPLQSSAAVIMGLVKPMPCPTCSGTGKSKVQP